MKSRKLKLDSKVGVIFVFNLVPKFMKGENQLGFKKSVQAYLGKTCKVNFAGGTLSECFEQIWKSKFPLIVHLLNFKKDHKKLINDIYSDEYMVEEVMNTQFKNYGIDANSDEIEPDFKKFVNQSHAPAFLVFRVNIFD